MAKKAKVVIVEPPRDLDDIADGLIELTEALHTRELADGSPGGILGGMYGYGANFEVLAFEATE